MQQQRAADGPLVAGLLLAGGMAAAAAAAAASWRYVLTGQALLGRPFRSRAVGIIPARYSSTRFPGKPLAPILGKPMIQRTWERARLARSLQAVVVATDDERIADCCRAFGADVVMTSPSCANGTERCAEASRKLPGAYDVVVNIQGDEPLVDPAIIDGIVLALQRSAACVGATAVSILRGDEAAAANPNRVKCVMDRDGHALYFSRAPVPFRRGAASGQPPYYLHLGLLCYDANFLEEYVKLPPTPLQEAEDLEQLRILEHGHKLKVIVVEHQGHGVDVPSDISSITAIMTEQNLV